MDEAITAYTFDDDASIRVKTIGGEPFFAVTDICKALGLTNTAKAVQALDEEDLSHVKIFHRTLLFVSEPGLYQLIFRSTKPLAVAFRKWISHEVIPSIRKTGQYSVNRGDAKAIEFEKLKLQVEVSQLVLREFPEDAHLSYLAKARLADTISLNGGTSTDHPMLKDLTQIMVDMGIPMKVIQQKRVHVGKFVVEKYRKKHSKDPGRVEKYVAGSHRKVCAYLPEDYDDVKNWINQAM